MQSAGTRLLKFISTSSPYLTTLWHDFIFPGQPMSESAAEHWRLNGTVLIACNCDWGCPCNFNAPPTTGKCEGGWTWHIDRGSFGDVTLDGLNFSVYVNLARRDSRRPGRSAHPD